MADTRTHAHWSSRATFLMAAVGAAVGLGNIWKFPYTTGVNGGGAFVLVYLGAALFIVVPILIAELVIGRRGQQSPPGAMAKLARESNSHPAWQGLGWLGVVTAFLILSLYNVIGAWIMAYVPKLLSGGFVEATRTGAEAEFADLLSDPITLIKWQTLFILLTACIIARGLRQGIERAISILMPALLIMLLGMVLYAAIAGDMGAAITFLFQPDFSRITPEIILIAVGQAFFSIGIGMAIMMTYGSYLPRTVSLTRSALIITVADTTVALLAGLAIFPLVFGNQLDPTEGPGLILVTLPMAFGNMPAGAILGGIFFLLIAVAALTSSISILEPIVAWTVERRGLHRVTATVFWAFLSWLLGLGSVFSFNLWADVRLLSSIPAYADKTVFDLMDHFTSNLMLPLAGLLTSLFVGWCMQRKALESELPLMPQLVLSAWIILLRYVVPVFLAVLIVVGIA